MFNLSTHKYKTILNKKKKVHINHVTICQLALVNTELISSIHYDPLWSIMILSLLKNPSQYIANGKSTHFNNMV